MSFSSTASTPPTADRSRHWMLALGISIGLAACAPLPKAPSSPVSALPDAQGLLSSQTLQAPIGAWPSNDWWTAYGDAQLNTLITEGLRDAPDMAVAAARLRSAQATAQASSANLEPQISANASATEQKLSSHYLTPAAATPKGWNDFGRVSFDLGWELDFWGKNRAALAAATSEQAASQAEWAQAQLVLASGIASAYAELARLFANQDIALKSVEVRRKTTDLLRQRQQHGLENQGVVREAEARLAAAEGGVIQVEEQMALQRHKLAALVGAGPDRGLRLQRPSFQLEQGFGLPPALTLDLLGRRPDITAARLQAEAQAQRIQQKSAEFYPNVNLTAFVGLQSLGLDMLARGGSAIGSVGPAISLPIFNAGRLHSELRLQEARYAESVARYQATLTRALQEVADAALSQRALAAKLQKSEETVQAASAAYQIARQRYEGGLATYLDVLWAEDTVLNSIGTLADLRTRSLMLDIALKRALGGGYQSS